MNSRVNCEWWYSIAAQPALKEQLYVISEAMQSIKMANSCVFSFFSITLRFHHRLCLVNGKNAIIGLWNAMARWWNAMARWWNGMARWWKLAGTMVKRDCTMVKHYGTKLKRLKHDGAIERWCDGEKSMVRWRNCNFTIVPSYRVCTIVLLCFHHSVIVPSRFHHYLFMVNCG
jgi:hypothetical protein